jgi:matrixin/VCBS repeat protein/FG-GAP repeat protein
MRVGVLWALALLVSSAVGSEPALLPEPAGLEARVARADVILIGVVEPAAETSASRGARRVVPVRVEEYFKGRRFPSRVTLAASPGLAPGDRVLLLAEDDDRGPLRPSGGARGVYRLRGGLAAPPVGLPVSRTRLEARIRAVVGVPPPALAGALLTRRHSLAGLTAEADVVVAAQVADLRARLGPRGDTIETDVTLRVERALKGGPSATLTLTLPGGAVGDTQLLVGGVPHFWPSERVLLFLRAHPSGLGLVGLWQGKFSLSAGLAIQPESGTRTPAPALEARVAALVAGQIVEAGDDEVGLVEPEFATFCQPWTPAQVPVTFGVNVDNPGPGAPGGPAFARLVHQAVQVWQDVETAWISGRVVGRTGPATPNNLDGESDVAWGSLDAYGSGLLALTFCTMRNGLRVEADVLLDNVRRTWSTSAAPGAIDLASVLRHEMGHAFGLGHTLAPCDSGPATPLMCPAIGPGVEKGLAADDVAGLTALYPLTGAAPPSPTGVRATAAGGHAILVEFTGADAPAYEIQRAAGGCAAPFVAIATEPALSTGYVDDDLGAGLAPGPYCYRVKALGVGGDSATSAPVPVDLLRLLGVFVATGELDGSGQSAIVTGEGPGGVPQVRSFRGDGTPLSPSFMAFDPAFRGGVRVASCDLDGDGRAEIITAAGPGGGPHVRAWRLGDGGATELFGFYAYAATFAGGVFVACGDLDGDGRAEIVTGSDAGGPPSVRVWKVHGTPPELTVTQVIEFEPYHSAFRGGVRVAVADVDGDGRAEVITGAGPGGGPHVRVFRIEPLAEVAGFYAYDPTFLGGVYVAGGDVDGTAGAEIVTGAGAGGGPHVRVFRLGPVGEVASFHAYDPGFTGGVTVAIGRLDARPASPGSVVTGAGPGGGAHVRGFALPGPGTSVSFMAY